MRTRIIKAFSGLMACAFAFTSCRKDEPVIPKPDNKQTTIDEIAKVRITLSNGHLHGTKSFHYVPSGGTFTYRNIYDRQEYTFVKNGDQWVLSSDAPYTDFIGYQVQQYDANDPTSAAPDYGAIIYLYNAKGSSSTISMPPRLTAPTISSSSTPRRLRTSMVRALASTQATLPAYSSMSTAIRTYGTSLQARAPRMTRGTSSTTSSRIQSLLASRGTSRILQSVSSR